jgi:hypothetical protein
MSRRLSATLDGKPVYLYEFVQGSYEDRRQLLYAHVEELPSVEITARFRAALATLPTEIEDYDYMGQEPDLVERALELAGFVPLHDAIPLGLALRGVGTPSLDREALERSLDRWEGAGP